MAWELWVGLVVAVTIVVIPLLPHAQTARGRRFQRVGWALTPATALAWAGFFALDPAAVAWLYYSAFVLVLGLTAALLSVGYICAAVRRASRTEGQAVYEPPGIKPR